MSLALNMKESVFLVLKYSVDLLDRCIDDREWRRNEPMNIEEWSRLKRHVYSFNQPLIALNGASDDSNPSIGCCRFLFFNALQLLRQLVTFAFPHVSSVSPCFCLRRPHCRRLRVVSSRRLYRPTERGSIHLRKQVCDFPPEWFRRTAFSQFFHRDLKWSDGQRSAQRILTSPLLFFILTLKPVTNPQRGDDKLRETANRACSSCGHPPYVWPPSVWSFQKPDEGCKFVYMESIYN